MVVVVVVASPTVGQQHGGGEPIAAAAVVSSPFHHRPTPASKIRGIPEVGKLPRTATTKKHPTAGTPAKPNSGNVTIIVHFILRIVHGDIYIKQVVLKCLFKLSNDVRQFSC